MGLKSSKGVESNTGQETKVFRTGNLGQSVGGAAGGGGGGTGNEFTMQLYTPTGLDGGITTHNSKNTSDYPSSWSSAGDPSSPGGGPTPGGFYPGHGARGAMYKFTSGFNGDIKVHLWGGGGTSGPNGCGLGGQGGYAEATLTVTDGMELYVVAAEGGGGKFDPQKPNGDTTYSPYGNFHGGRGPRGSGGGFSGIFYGSGPTDLVQPKAVIMAGGGGGGGGTPNSGPTGWPAGGSYGAPVTGNTGESATKGGTPTGGGAGGWVGSRVAGGSGEALIGGGHSTTSPSFAQTGGGAGYYGGGGAGDSANEGGAGGCGYIGGHPQVPISGGVQAMSNYPGSPQWPQWPTTGGNEPWENMPLPGRNWGMAMVGNGGQAGPAGPNFNNYAKCGKVIIEVINDE